MLLLAERGPSTGLGERRLVLHRCPGSLVLRAPQRSMLRSSVTIFGSGR